MQKILSAGWNALSDVEKETFAQSAKMDKGRYEREKLVLVDAGVYDKLMLRKKQEASAKEPSRFALARVKKIVVADESVTRVSKDALLAISNAAVGSFIVHLFKLYIFCRNVFFNFLLNDVIQPHVKVNEKQLCKTMFQKPFILSPLLIFFVLILKNRKNLEPLFEKRI